MNQDKPYFSVIIPLYNKQNHIKETVETVLSQTFQDFEIIIINDGSKDNSLKIVETIIDNRIRIINQENQGVSIARNNGIKEAKANYIAFLDADDNWLSQYLETIYNLTIDFPKEGIYATGYNMMDKFGNKTSIDFKALPTKDFIGIIPNYFKSIALGNNPAWTSAVCIPRKIFIDNNIWFPEGEKYGEDAHVWIRVAMIYNVVYNSKVCAIYNTNAENNTIDDAFKVKTPHKSITSLSNYRETIRDPEKLKYFDIYMDNRLYKFIWLNIRNKDRKYAIKNFLNYSLSFKHKFLLVIFFFIPHNVFLILKKLKKGYKNVFK